MIDVGKIHAKILHWNFKNMHYMYILDKILKQDNKNSFFVTWFSKAICFYIMIF